ncbi:DUF2185 domain-containing protein [Clostridium sp. JS66]|uniref:immunity protein Imm33 domain-containing protein n=1 Tax=Clostridium sp. JS66 TaxID=3064705 RepID=UPI00298DCE9C|nr:DUF2185 domain-containing protein [Clostridium sp. JS66]WPC40103.1 DUF2185 domain-containing protein [Clostridium sp. JS66]
MEKLNTSSKINQEFYLENVVEKNLQFPRTFLIPNKEEVGKLEIGNLVKLVFVMEELQEDGCRAEKMWVEIVNKQKDEFTGILTNNPYYLKSIKWGDMITFEEENIASTYGKKAAFDEKEFAIITKKALEKRQVNWVVRTDDLDNDQDSGWQLFYGDESEQYLDDYANANIISLEDVLSFEPLLEEVFSNFGYAYEYSEAKNKFVEVKE